MLKGKINNKEKKYYTSVVPYYEKTNPFGKKELAYFAKDNF
jgi:hypothetical protein